MRNLIFILLLQEQFVPFYRPSQILLVVFNGSHFNLYTSDTTGTYYMLSLENIAVLEIPNVGYYGDLEIVSYAKLVLNKIYNLVQHIPYSENIW